MKPLEEMLLMQKALRQRRTPSVMNQQSAPAWQPEYEKEPPLEQVSPEDFIPNPKTALAALKGIGPMVGAMGAMKNVGSNAQVLPTMLYRGLDRPNDPSRVNPIDWFSESRDLAEKYGNNIISREKSSAMTPADLGFRDYMTEVKKDDVLDRVKRAVIDRFSSGALDKETAMRNVDKIEDMRGGNDFKRVHEWVSGDPSIPSILRESGYDSLSHVENGTQTYGLLNDLPTRPITKTIEALRNKK